MLEGPGYLLVRCHVVGRAMQEFLLYTLGASSMIAAGLTRTRMALPP